LRQRVIIACATYGTTSTCQRCVEARTRRHTHAAEISTRWEYIALGEGWQHAACQHAWARVASKEREADAESGGSLTPRFFSTLRRAWQQEKKEEEDKKTGERERTTLFQSRAKYSSMVARMAEGRSIFQSPGSPVFHLPHDLAAPHQAQITWRRRRRHAHQGPQHKRPQVTGQVIMHPCIADMSQKKSRRAIRTAIQQHAEQRATKRTS